jgi:tRNA A-37 threonylcarbamoyl transferase component Bud32
MSVPDDASDSSLPLSAVDRIDDACCGFAAVWKAGQRPRLEDFLYPAEQREQQALLRALLPLDVGYRARTGETPTPEDYLARFPHAAGLIEDLLSRDSASGRTNPEQQTRSEPAALCAAGPPAIPGYEVLEKIAEGGMGVVYKARQVKANRIVALKMILSGSHAGQAQVARFRTEVEAIARLQHPNIVQVYEVGETEGRPYFSLEYCEGGSLDRKTAGDPLPPNEAARLTETLARAIGAAHKANVIHRDLKPANVLLTADGTPKITDFGLAKKLDEASQTQDGDVIGTPSYMAPEQAGGKKDVGPAADVYALGAILYDLLTGRPPFKAATTLDTLMQVVAEEPVPPGELNAKVPKDVETICLKCLSKDSRQRYATAEDLAEDLRRWQAGEPITARRVWWIGRAMKWVRRRPVIAALSAAVVVAMVAGTAVSLHFGLRAQAKEKEAREALGAVEETLAVGLLRPLGHLTTEKVLNPFELDALEYLAGLPRERDRVRMLFLNQALRAPDTTGQLGRRLEEALIAAVGLRADLRAQVMEEAAARLEDAGTSREAKVVSASILAQLRCDKENLVLSTAAILEEDMLRGSGRVAVSADLAGIVDPENWTTS